MRVKKNNLHNLGKNILSSNIHKKIDLSRKMLSLKRCSWASLERSAT